MEFLLSPLPRLLFKTFCLIWRSIAQLFFDDNQTKCESKLWICWLSDKMYDISTNWQLLKCQLELHGSPVYL